MVVSGPVVMAVERFGHLAVLAGASEQTQHEISYDLNRVFHSPI
jgi:hypothetical protein